MAEQGHSGGRERTLPKDAQVIAAMLKDAGIQEWEPRVVNQLLEFIYRELICPGIPCLN